MSTQDLPVQPRSGQLTLATEVVRIKGKPYVWALCDCGRFIKMQRGVWLDGGSRPQSCAKCALPRKRRGFKVDVFTRADIVPYWRGGGD